MSRREDVDNGIWGDPTFEDLSPEAKLLYLWSFTNPYCNMAGLYRVSPQRMSRDTGLTPQRNRRASEELEAAGLLHRTGEWLWVRSRVKHLRTKSPNMAASIVRDVSQLGPTHTLRAQFIGEYVTWPWLVEKGGESWRRLCDDTVAAAQSVTSTVTSDSRYLSQNTEPSMEGPVNPPGQGKGSLSYDNHDGETDDLDAAERIFEHWRATLAPNARFTRTRRDKVRARLKHYPAERILRAIDGCAASEFHVANGHVDLELICRSDEKLEQFEGRPLRPDRPTRRDGTVVQGPGMLSHRTECRAPGCARPIGSYEANNQSGLCDKDYEARFGEAAG